MPSLWSEAESTELLETVENVRLNCDNGTLVRASVSVYLVPTPWHTACRSTLRREDLFQRMAWGCRASWQGRPGDSGVIGTHLERPYMDSIAGKQREMNILRNHVLMLSRVCSILDQELQNPKKTSPTHLLSVFLGFLENTWQYHDDAPSVSRWLSDGFVPNTIPPPLIWHISSAWPSESNVLSCCRGGHMINS